MSCPDHCCADDEQQQHAYSPDQEVEDAASILLPTWYPPQPTGVVFQTGLHVKNSLTRSKVPFVTLTGTNQLTWYMYVR